MQPMRDEHASCAPFGTPAGSACPFAAPRPAGMTRRVLYRLYTLLKVHLAEEELYLQASTAMSRAQKEASRAASTTRPGTYLI
jgi:hypothetical protein